MRESLALEVDGCIGPFVDMPRLGFSNVREVSDKNELTGLDILGVAWHRLGRRLNVL